LGTKKNILKSNSRVLLKEGPKNKGLITLSVSDTIVNMTLVPIYTFWSYYIESFYIVLQILKQLPSKLQEFSHK
jgi:hypothetical protein